MSESIEYPHLFQEKIWDWGPVHISFEPKFPPPELLSNVNISPFDESGWIIVRQARRWGIIGGTMEPNETYLETIRRELMEEAGCKLKSFKAFGALRMEFMTDQPYRPHLPFPVSYRLLGVGEVERVSAPSNPNDGEQILEVASFSLEEACRLLEVGGEDGPLLADIYRYASNFLSNRV